MPPGLTINIDDDEEFGDEKDKELLAIPADKTAPDNKKDDAVS